MKKSFVFLSILILALSCSEEKKSLQIMCIGDSITQGKVTGDSITELSYRYWLWEKLDSAGYIVDLCGTNNIWFNEDRENLLNTPVSQFTSHIFDRDHEAYYGIRSDEFLNGGFTHNNKNYPHFSERLANFNPDITLIHLGSNDKEADSAVSVQNLSELIDLLYENNREMHIFLARLNTPWNRSVNHSIDTIISMSRQRNPEIFIRWVDHASGWVNRPDIPEAMTLDWAHPNVKGQKFMAEKWYKAISSISDTTPPEFDAEIIYNQQDIGLQINWEPATDDYFVAGYDVLLNGEKVNWRYSEAEDQAKQCIALTNVTEYLIKDYVFGKNDVIEIIAWDYGNNFTISR